jgi:outer membrane protein TolC
MSRLASSLFILAMLFVPAGAAADEGVPIDPSVIVAEVAAQNPSVRAALLEAQRAAQSVIAEEGRYAFVLQLEGNADAGRTPSLSSMGVLIPSSQTYRLGASISRQLPFGMNIAVSLDGQRFQRNAQIVPSSSQTVQIGPGYGLGLSLDVTQSLLRGFGSDVGWADRDLARLDAKRVDLETMQTASLAIADALTGYYELWYAEQALSIERGALALARRQHEEALARVQLGALSEVDALELEAQVAALAEQVVMKEGDVAARRDAVLRLLGVGRERTTTPAYTAVEAPLGDADIDVAVSVENALAGSPEIAALDAAVESAERAARVAGDALRPRLDLSLSVTAQGLGDRDVAAAFSQVGRFQAVRAVAGVVYEMSLDTGPQKAERTRARLAVQVAEQRRAEAAERVASEVRTQATAFDSARRRAELAETSVRVARRLAEAQTERLGLGTVTVTQVLEATNNLREAELRSARAAVDAAVATVQLDRLTGMLATRYAGALIP